jgi:hypothetical protein
VRDNTFTRRGASVTGNTEQARGYWALGTRRRALKTREQGLTQTALGKSTMGPLAGEQNFGCQLPRHRFQGCPCATFSNFGRLNRSEIRHNIEGARHRPCAYMTIRALLVHRREELLKFLSWRFGTRYWTGPFCYATGLPRWLAKKLTCRSIEFSCSPRPANVLTIRDLLRAEDAALHLGFQPTLPDTASERYLQPPPPNLPPASDPSVRIRFTEWQALNPRDKVPKRERKMRRDRASGENMKTAGVSVEIVKKPSPMPELTADAERTPGAEDRALIS